MRFCEEEHNYKCGIYITTEVNKEIVMKVIDNLLPIYNREVEIRNNHCESFIKYPNGNLIRIVRANNSARGQRFNGMIVDYNISKEIIDTVILPHLMPLRIGENMYDIEDNPLSRMYYCPIIKEDVIESEKCRQLLYVSSAEYSNWNQYQRDMLDAMLYSIQFKNNNYIKFEKEYECMWISSEYNTAIKTCERDGNKILLFNALGVPKENITYKTEFVNKSKETYLIIQGSVELEDLGYENGINVRMRIDTDIYDGYDVRIEDGLVFVRLHEIVNEAPVLKDYSTNQEKK